MKAIAAMDLNRTIGNKGKLPWESLKEDFKWFKKKTQESGKMVMGKTTFQEVGSLPNDSPMFLLTLLSCWRCHRFKHINTFH